MGVEHDTGQAPSQVEAKPPPEEAKANPELEEFPWYDLLVDLEEGQCAPFIGAGACWPHLPLGGDVAQAWANEHDYPFGDSRNLVRVSQYLATKLDDNDAPKRRIVDRLRPGDAKPPDFTLDNDPHGVLARLKLPLYITTNYDGYMTRALAVDGRPARALHCNWWGRIEKDALGNAVEKEPDAPTVDHPVVYHLHGRLGERKSLVLTEDDYLNFLINVSRDEKRLPSFVRAAFKSKRMLFIGYSLEDVNFKVLLRQAQRSTDGEESAQHIAVQLAPNPTKGDQPDLALREKQASYLRKQFNSQRIRVCYCDCRSFAAELARRWRERQKELAGG